MISHSSKMNIRVGIIGGILVALIMIVGTLWMGHSASDGTKKAVQSVSLFYLDELAGRREEIVEKNLNDNIEVINTAIDSLSEEDLSDDEHLQEFQRRMKNLFQLDKFAFVDESGLIYTSTGTKTDIDKYPFNHETLSEAEIYVKDINEENKTVIIAVPVNSVSFKNHKLMVCFMEIEMDEMLQGVSVASDESKTTYCNLYSSEGIALSNKVLSGQANVNNLFKALEIAKFDKDYSLKQVKKDFADHKRGVITFNYNGIQETLTYVPIEGTDWMLTYLIRENVISERIKSISDATILRSIIQSCLATAILLIMFYIIARQMRSNANLVLEKETAETENRIKQAELENRLSLQEELLNQKKLGEEQDRLITALASDYWSVYYLELDTGEGVCYQQHSAIKNGLKAGDRFDYLYELEKYASSTIKDEYKQEFIDFVQPDSIRERLKTQRVIAYRYMVRRHGVDSYEEIRFAGVRHPEDREDHIVHAVGACFVNVDSETRKTMEQSRALQEALSAAEQANKAKTTFLSNMSHEIRTPMNAIIGLNSIILNDSEISDKVREHSEKIGTSANHLLGIINDILDMSRIESGRMVVKKEEFSFSKMLEQVNTIIGGQCKDKGLEYECHMKGDVDDYYVGDDVKLRQVLLNILGNSVKFTPEGGRISLLVENINHYDKNVTLRFTMIDNGCGMSEEYLPHLFEPFTQEDALVANKYGSTGLGMPITKSVVELMNGHIDVESRKNVGTTFIVTVTLHESEKERDELTKGEIDVHDISVLVIDDDAIACEHANVVMGQVGIKCETVTSGQEAIEMVRVKHGRREDYDLILVDWKMPEMDGIETTKRIREIVGYHTPIIILTSYNWDETAEEARKAGVDTFVSKPLFAGNVMDEFKEAFRKKNESEIKQKKELAGRRVLLAEDVDVNAEIMSMVLEMKDISVDTAENGRVAVDKFISKPAGYYDAILMDMRMPEMDGLEATKAIRALERDDAKTIPIIALTANAFDEDVQRSLQAGMNAHLSKPVEPDVLFKTLEDLI